MSSHLTNAVGARRATVSFSIDKPRHLARRAGAVALDLTPENGGDTLDRMKRIQPLASLLLFAVLPASAAWTVTRTGAPSGCSHVISDGNWQIGVYRYSDDNWSLGKQIGYNGSPPHRTRSP